MPEIIEDGKLILNDLRGYVKKINKTSKDQLINDIPDIVKKVNTIGILNTVNEIGLELANKIDLHKLKSKVDSFKLHEIEDLFSRFLPFVIEVVLLVAPKFNSDYLREYVILRDKLFEFKQSDYVETFERIVPVVLKEGIKITELIREDKYEELNNEAPTLVEVLKNDFSESSIDFLIKVPAMLGELDSNFLNGLIIPIIAAIIYLDKCVEGYQEENPRVKMYIKKLKSKEIPLKAFMLDLITKAEEAVLVILSETKSILSFSESIKILPQILTLIIKQVGKQAFVEVKEVGFTGLKMTGQLPGVFEVIDVSKSEIEKSGMAGIWIDLNIDSLALIFLGVKGIASLIHQIGASEFISIKNLDRWIEMLKHGVDGWPPSDKMEATILSIFTGISGLLERESIFRLVETILYPAIDSALRKYAC
ncbi:MAG: hypothetical protein EAX96_21360 [Candidatus Lokiarchaeota archaeon]|nr:hypothetical protein [Candidatus Lokiarchaeota archaeon]